MNEAVVYSKNGESVFGVRWGVRLDFSVRFTVWPAVLLVVFFILGNEMP